MSRTTPTSRRCSRSAPSVHRPAIAESTQQTLKQYRFPLHCKQRSKNMRECEENIFDRWRNSLPNELQGQFVTDGVVNEALYLESNLKILFLLKEVNDPDGGGWCLREFLRNGGRWQTFGNATRWLRAIRNLPNEMPWDQLKNVADEQRIAELQSIAAMNLKKTPGGHAVDHVNLWNSVTRDQKFIHEQFNLYHADLVICCGSDVAKAFSYIFGESGGLPWNITTRGIEYYEYEQNKYAISFSHPSVRASSNLVHYGLIDAVREICHNAEWMRRAH